MKNLILLIALSCSGVLLGSSRYDLQGFYESESNNRQYELKHEDGGLLFKERDDRRFRFFEKVGRRTFESRNGHQLIIRNNNRLIYNINGREIQLNRMDRNRRDRQGFYNGYRNGSSNVYTRQRSCYDKGRGIAGTWVPRHNRHRSERIHIDETRHGIIVHSRGHHSKARKYRLVENWDRVRVFESRNGDRFSLHRNGDLVWHSRRGHYRKTYTKKW